MKRSFMYLYPYQHRLVHPRSLAKSRQGFITSKTMRGETAGCGPRTCRRGSAFKREKFEWNCRYPLFYLPKFQASLNSFSLFFFIGAVDKWSSAVLDLSAAADACGLQAELAIIQKEIGVLGLASVGQVEAGGKEIWQVYMCICVNMSYCVSFSFPLYIAMYQGSRARG